MNVRHVCAGLVLSGALLAAGCAACGHHCRPAPPPPALSAAPPCCTPAPAPCCGEPGAVPVPPGGVPVPAVSSAPPYYGGVVR